MGIKRHKPDEIVTKLRQVEVLCGQGMLRIDAIRQVRVTEQTFYRWRTQYSGLGIDQLKELKRLQKESERLRRAVPVSTLCEAGSTSQRVGLAVFWGSTDQHKGGCQLAALMKTAWWPT